MGSVVGFEVIRVGHGPSLDPNSKMGREGLREMLAAIGSNGPSWQNLAYHIGEAVFSQADTRAADTTRLYLGEMGLNGAN